MGLNVGNLNNANYALLGIDQDALNKVTAKIFNSNEKSIDVSKLDLSKFNRTTLGMDLYASRTNSDVALKAAKALTDFDVNFSKAYAANIQYLNSQAAQSLFTSKENNGKVVVSVDNTNEAVNKKVETEATQISQANQMDKDKKGSNPFSFYMATQGTNEKDDNEQLFG